MNLLLLLYAMIAGLTGINAGPAAMTRAQEVAQGRAVAATVAAAACSQVEIALHAMSLRRAAGLVVHDAAFADARRVAMSLPGFAIVTGTRAAPERRRE